MKIEIERYIIALDNYVKRFRHMPYPETDYRFQKAQLWERVGDDNYANPILGARQQLSVRWEDKQIEMLAPNGQPIKLDAIVVIACITVPIGSIMWKGCLDDLPADLTTLTNLMEVVAYNDTPDIKGRVSRKTLGLKRYNDKMPEIQ